MAFIRRFCPPAHSSPAPGSSPSTLSPGQGQESDGELGALGGLSEWMIFEQQLNDSRHRLAESNLKRQGRVLEAKLELLEAKLEVLAREVSHLDQRDLLAELDERVDALEVT